MPEKIKITQCPPSPYNPDLCFQRYAFDKELGEAPGTQRNVELRDSGFLASREIKTIMSNDFLEGCVLQALIDCAMPPGEAVQLIKEINGGQID